MLVSDLMKVSDSEMKYVINIWGGASTQLISTGMPCHNHVYFYGFMLDISFPLKVCFVYQTFIIYSYYLHWVDIFVNLLKYFTVIDGKKNIVIRDWKPCKTNTLWTLVFYIFT